MQKVKLDAKCGQSIYHKNCCLINIKYLKDNQK